MEAAPKSATLAGWCVISLRERGQQAAAARAIRAAGAQPLALPGLKLTPLDAAAALRGALALSPAIALCVSPNALRFALRLCPELPRRVPCGAGVGAATARALQRAGFKRVLQPAGAAPQTSEGLLENPELREGVGRGLLLIAAPGGRNVLEQTLRARGFKLRRVEVYARGPARLDARHFRALESAAAPLALLMSSAEALDHVLAALPAELLPKLQSARVAASSPRLIEHARERGFTDLRLARGPAPAELLRALSRKGSD
jgi:uroporphyrinogen-III synthase